MDFEKLETVITSWQNKILQIEGIERDFEKDLLGAMGSKPIKILTGFRRSGKSFVVRRVAKLLVENNHYELENILYLNFEDLATRDLINNAQELNRSYEWFSARADETKPKLIILDEVQNIKDWDRFVRSVYESITGTELEIIITGSNSELLSSELGSNLAGRFIEFKILPFSFKEYCKYHGLVIKSEKDFHKHQTKISSLFERYMEQGGMPETFSISQLEPLYSYLEGVKSKVILDDIIERFQIKNSYVLDRVLIYLIANVGNAISFARIADHLEQIDASVDDVTLVNYASYFVKSFFLYEVQKFDWKTTKVFNTSKKYYSVDPGLAFLYRPLANNYSRRLENICYLELRRRSGIADIHYGLSGDREIDFIVQDSSSRAYIKYQISKELNSLNQKRELGVFEQVDKFLKGGENFFLSLDEGTSQLVVGDSLVNKLNIKRWLLQVGFL